MRVMPTRLRSLATQEPGVTLCVSWGTAPGTADAEGPPRITHPTRGTSMPASMGSARGSLLPGDCKLKSHPHLQLAMLGLLMLGIGCGEASHREASLHGTGLGRAALVAEEPTCVIFQRGTSGE